MKQRVNIRVPAVCALLLAAAVIDTSLVANGRGPNDGWLARDVGRAGVQGRTIALGGSVFVTGAGTGVGGAADSFQFAYRRFTGDGEIVTLVANLDALQASMRAGLMMRESLTAGARHATLLVSAGQGAVFEQRGDTGGGTSARQTSEGTPAAASEGRAVPRATGASGVRDRSGSTRTTTTLRRPRSRPVVAETTTAPVPMQATGGHHGSVPLAIKLVRTGHRFSAYKSHDGVNWIPVGTATIAMRATIYVGLAVTSQVAGHTATATFLETSVRGVTSASAVSSASGTGTPAAPATAPAPPAVQAPAPPPAATPPSAPSTPSAPAAPPVQPAPPAQTPPSTSTGPVTFRLLHWNVRHGGRGTDDVYDPDRVAAWVARMNPDIISFNEVDDADQAERLRGLVSAHTGAAWRSTYSGRGNQILTRVPVQTTSVCVYNTAVGRRAAHVRLPMNGRTVNIWSAHLSVDSATDRLNEVRALQGCAADQAEARVIAGDFNMQVGSPEYQQAVSSYVDAWARARSQGTSTNYSGNCDGCTRNSRIDYVFASAGASFLTVESVRVYDTRDSRGHMPSDHKPIVVTYAVRP